MYYGEFLASLDFDDGWRDMTYKHLKEYVSLEQTENPEITITCSEIGDRVQVILQSDDISEKSVQKIYDISHSLQREYLCSVFEENIHPLFKAKNILFPFRVEIPHVGEHYHTRCKLQEVLIELEKLNRSRKQLDYMAEKIAAPHSDYAQTITTLLQQIDQIESPLKLQLAEFVSEEYAAISIEKKDDIPVISLPRDTQNSAKTSTN